MTDNLSKYRISLDSQLDKLEQIVKDKPEDPSSLFAFAEMAFRRGRNLVALSAFQKLLDIKPEVVDVHLGLAKIYASLKMYADSFRELTEALKIDKSSVEARVLYDIFTKEIDAKDHPLLISLSNFFSAPLNAADITLYVQQLNIEKDRLVSDVRELSSLLESSPMDTILEYEKNMAERRLTVIQELSDAAQNTDQPPKEPLTLSEEKTPEALLKPIEPLIEKLKKTRGVTTIFGITREGQVIPLLADKELNLEQFSKVLSDNMTILSKFMPELLYWVIQCEKGLMILQRFSAELTLAVVGDESTNFGTLHYIMDKSHP